MKQEIQFEWVVSSSWFIFQQHSTFSLYRDKNGKMLRNYETEENANMHTYLESFQQSLRQSGKRSIWEIYFVRK